MSVPDTVYVADQSTIADGLGLQETGGIADDDQQLVKFHGLYLQDEFEVKRLTLKLGVRAEHWEHFSTTGFSIFAFDWTLAPRLSAAYDITGNGRHKASAYWGTTTTRSAWT